ncbi:MAG: glutamate--tRNA ligase [Deltaproteobacteria bacterium]
MDTPRLRFAPSPTGYLHIGGARTALFNWLYARRFKGRFILRMEDTDRERSTPESVRAILDGLRWLGIDWDEGPEVGGPHGPYFQSERVPLYRETVERLIREKKAYRCYCTKDELDARRKVFETLGRPYKYEGTCRERADEPDRPFVVRLRLPDGGAVRFEDLVCGAIRKEVSDLYDEVLCRSDYVPLYDFGCVVDDHAMAVTIVGRGQEHINSTFPQLVLYDYLGFAPPKFAHFPLILGADREKLSKRLHPEADVMQHRRNGILPEALKNFIVRLGWSHGNDEVLSVAQMTEWFDFDHVGTTSGVWNPEKLLWLNQHWLKAKAPAELEEPFLAQLRARGVGAEPGERLRGIIRSQQERSHTLAEMAELSSYFFAEPKQDPKAAEKFLTPAQRPVLERVRGDLAKLPGFEAAAIEPVFKAAAEALGVGMGKVAQPVRVALTGGTVSPPIHDLVALLGRDASLARLDQALARLDQAPARM